MHLATLTIVGVGLIGGSVGLAAKQRGLARSVRGVGRSLSNLERARAFGAIDEIYLDLAQAVTDADLVVFCTPVDRIAEQVLACAPHCKTGALLTDAGSTKGQIVAAVEGKLPAGVAFVGSHPLAGSEKRGPEPADAKLFQNRWTVVTRTPHTDAAALEKTVAFWHALGSREMMRAPDDHDRALAMTSHLPHLLAAALAGLLPENLFSLTAGGFRDTTRIAAGDPALWSAIFNHNRAALLDTLVPLKDRLLQFQQALDNHDDAAILALLSQAKKVRDALGS